MTDVFISYKREDVAEAEKLYKLLTESGYEVWMDKYRIAPGSYWPEEIDKGLRSTKVTVGMISLEALQSRNVINEWDYTITVDKPLVLLKIKEFPIEEMSHRFISINYIDMIEGVEKVFQRLVTTIQSFLHREKEADATEDNTVSDYDSRKDESQSQVQKSATTLEDVVEVVSELVDDMEHETTTRPTSLEDEPPTVKVSANIPVREQLNSKSIKYRQQLIKRMTEYWIDGYLKQSLRFGVISVELEESREYVLHHNVYGDYKFNGSGKLVDIFNDVNGQLLILGSPGAGKTTLMLQLAEDLLLKASTDHDAPIPIILSLTSWANTWTNPEDVGELSLKNRKQITEFIKNELKRNKIHLTVSDWVIGEIVTDYEVPEENVRLWLEEGRLTFLFDGLDEVSPEFREQCIAFINDFKTHYPKVDLLVCSRLEEYDELSANLDFSTALMVQNISSQQARRYLVDNASSELVNLYDQHDAIYELFRTPFWLSFATHVYQTYTTSEVEITFDNATRAVHIFETYTLGMLHSLSESEKQKLLKKIGRLALQMETLGLSVVHPDRINFQWLNKKEAGVINKLKGGGAVYSVINALVLVPIFSLSLPMLVATLATGLAFNGAVVTTAFKTLRKSAVVSKLLMKNISKYDIDQLLAELVELGMMYKLGNGYLFLHLSLRDYISQNYSNPDDKPQSGKSDESTD